MLRTPRRVTALSAAAAALLAGALLAQAAGSDPSTMTSASGRTYDFSPTGGVVAGATVRVREHPDLGTTTDQHGSWRIDGLPVGSVATFVLEAPGRLPVETAELAVPPDGLRDVAFQTPGAAMVSLLEAIVGEQVRADRCQIATTVTRRGHTLGDAHGPHGEPGATVTIDPPVSRRIGPIYFDLARVDLIWPDRALEATTADGGALFVNVPPGRYELRAHKAGATIDPVTVTCRPGVIANAAPPHGLQVRSGGLEPGEDPEPTDPALPTTAPSAPPTAPPPIGPTGDSPMSTPSPARPAATVAGRPSYAG